MRFHKIVLTGLTTLAGLGMASQAMADGRNPGSLLVYPEFDNRVAVVTVLTLTNTATNMGDVDVEFVYIGAVGAKGQQIDCEEFNRTVTMTDNDTLTLITNVHNPQHEQGYVYVFARDGVNSPIDHDYLIGNVMTVSGIEMFEFSVNPFSYQGIAPGSGDNGVRDLDDNEYEASPGMLLVPRFLGQGGIYNSELILVGLSGSKFDITVDFLIYNDNEEEFSSEHTFYCWERTYLLEISGIFDNYFLREFTNHDPNEIIGARQIETGWFRMWGSSASSSTTTLQDPAVLAMLLEKIANRGVADLPFETGTNVNGKLLPRDLQGEN